MNNLGLLPYDSEIVTFLRRLDRDEDGVITTDELARFLRRFDSYTYTNTRAQDRRCVSKDIIRNFSPGRNIVKNQVTLLTSGLEGKASVRDLEANVPKPSNVSVRRSPLKNEVALGTRNLNNSIERLRNQRDYSKEKSIPVSNFTIQDCGEKENVVGATTTYSRTNYGRTERERNSVRKEAERSPKKGNLRFLKNLRSSNGEKNVRIVTTGTERGERPPLGGGQGTSAYERSRMRQRGENV